MASTILFANNAVSNLAGPISNTATTANLTPGSGVLFPNPGAGQIFKLTFIDAATGLLNEIVNVTAISTDTITMVRGQEGTTALSWLAGDLAQSLWTAGCADAMVQASTSGSINASRIVTTSGAFTMSTSDYAVGLDRTSSPAVSSTTLPSGSQSGQAYSIEDLAGNFNAYPVTVNAPVGMTIAGESSITLNVNRQSVIFRYYGSNIWSVNL